MTHVQGVGPGSVLGGRYAVTLRTSEGTHHERWRANDHTLEREVVLVCFPAASSVAAPALDAARRAAGIEDPRLVRVLDVGTDRGVGFIVEEPLTGATPLSHLLQSGGLSADEVRRLTGEAATALEKAGHRGLHHLALTPSSLLRMPDGAVKVRGLATEAALTDTDLLSDERASRADAVGLVKIAYAGLTGRWPMVSVDDGLIPAGGSVGLESAPTIVGGVAAPSEIAVGVPNDLDLICRMTLASGRRGPVSPGDLALQIAPWAAEQATSDGATGIRLRSREELEPTRVLPAVGAGAAAVGAGAGASAGAGVAGASPSGDAAQTDTFFFDSLSDMGGGSLETSDRPDDDEAGRGSHGIAAGAAAAGAAAAGVASVIGDRVGSFARAAADKAAARAAERRSAHDDFDGEEIGLDDALDEAPTARLEPPLPVFGHDVPESPSGAQSRIALAIVGVLVLVALVIGIENVAKIGQHDGPVGAVTVTRTRPPSATQAPKPTTTKPPAATTTAPPAAGPVSIIGGSGFDPQDGNEADQNVKRVFDGNPGDGWRSRWYGTPTYNGDKDGVGVLLDLSGPTVVKEVDLVLGAEQDVTVYATNSDSTRSLEGAQEVGSATGANGTVTIKAGGQLSPASKLVVLVTKAGPAETDRRYRAQINEVTVR
ncbi:protein kinase family protein [Terrabacter terrigena]|uniref:Protein kinase family protein n=1 Tax=Terrabacter terrigena TaxID=574718 RepID=A0ABW3MX21_9MICO